MNFRITIIALGLLTALQGTAQGPVSLSLQQALDLAAKQSYQVQNSELEAEKARQRIKEVTAVGLPQINASGGLSNYIDVPTQVVPDFFGGDQLIQVQFGVPWSMNGGIQLDQLIFDGSYIVGLQAAKEARKISDEELERNIKQARMQAAKAYYAVLAADEGARLLGETLPVVERSLKESEALLANGFAEVTDVERLRIEVSSVRDQQQLFQRQAELARNYLRFMLGMPLSTPITLTNDLDALINDAAEMAMAEEPFDAAGHIDQRVADTYVRAGVLQVRNAKAAYMPSLRGFFSHQQQWNARDFEPFNGPIPWFPATLWGLQLNVPLFSSGLRSSRLSQQRIGLEQAELNQSLTRERLALEHAQRRTDVQGAQDRYRSERERLEVARRIFERTGVKYAEGVASSFELTQEQTRYISAQQSYIQRVVDLVNARAELRMALDRF
jgi:outer membrane protein TolC